MVKNTFIHFQWPSDDSIGQSFKRRRESAPADLATGTIHALKRFEVRQDTVATTQGPTTLILRNIPLDYSRAMLLEMFDSNGFAGRYDFVYLPRDFERSCGIGYAFVNTVTHADALCMQKYFQGFRNWALPTQKICDVTWSKQQRLKTQIQRYRNSPLMHHLVPDEYKPVLFSAGVRVDFPAPTKSVKFSRGLGPFGKAGGNISRGP